MFLRFLSWNRWLCLNSLCICLLINFAFTEHLGSNIRIHRYICNTQNIAFDFQMTSKCLGLGELHLKIPFPNLEMLGPRSSLKVTDSDFVISQTQKLETRALGCYRWMDENMRKEGMESTASAGEKPSTSSTQRPCTELSPPPLPFLSFLLVEAAFSKPESQQLTRECSSGLLSPAPYPKDSKSPALSSQPVSLTPFFYFFIIFFCFPSSPSSSSFSFFFFFKSNPNFSL